MQEFVYWGPDSSLSGQVKEIIEHPDPVTSTKAPLSESEILNIKLHAIAAKLAVDLDAAVTAASEG
jgi:hypothetical protein